MAAAVVTNWFGDLVSHPAVIVDAHSVDDIIKVLKEPATYPAPVRAVGSNHSTTRCGVADTGTLIRMKMNRILAIGADTLTAEAGATHFQMARALKRKQLQFYVNTEIGSLTAGSAACAGTKDASFAGEFGQVGSYVIGMKLVLPSGDLLEVTDAQPELMQLFRSSYGTFGIVYEVTFRVRPLLPMAVYHETFTLEQFVAKLPALKARQESMMFYVFPFENLITVEFRKYNPGASGPKDRVGWRLRNHLWGVSGPRIGHDVEMNVSDPVIRYDILDHFNASWRFTLEHLVKSGNTLPPDQIIDYPPQADDSRYTFSLFAFPEAQYPQTLSEFFKFSHDYYQQHGYRINLIDVGYYIAQDQQSLLSYSFDGAVMTIDPVSTANPGWDGFVDAYNQFCSDRGGLPLFNQTIALTPAIVKKAFGSRLTQFGQKRREYDPGNRLLNDFFRTLLGDEA
jgi:FAD/FMN-containing dehydrogenase